jgi:hypothetical protein
MSGVTTIPTCYRVCKRTAWILIILRGCMHPCWSKTHYVGFVMTRLNFDFIFQLMTIWQAQVMLFQVRQYRIIAFINILIMTITCFAGVSILYLIFKLMNELMNWVWWCDYNHASCCITFINKYKMLTWSINSFEH